MAHVSKKSTRIDTHHLLWPKAHYNVGYAKRLREFWYLSVEIPQRTLHAQIHRRVSVIPLPSGLACKMALEELVHLDNYGAIHADDPIEKRLEILISMFKYVSPFTARALEHQLRVVNEIKNPP